MRHQNQFNFIMFICCLNFATPMLVRMINPNLLYLIPFAVTTLYMAAFVKNRVVIPIYLISMLPLMIIAENGIELFAINALSGVIALLSFTLYSRGWMQFVNSLFVFAGLTILHIGFSMSYVKDASDAVISGNVARMEEAGNFELKKLAFNAMRKTGEEMALSYVGSEKDDFVDDIKDKNFEIIKGFGVKMLDKYNIYGHAGHCNLL